MPSASSSSNIYAASRTDDIDPNPQPRFLQQTPVPIGNSTSSEWLALQRSVTCVTVVSRRPNLERLARVPMPARLDPEAQ